MTMDHELITCSCRVGKKDDLCAPKIAAMMKIQKFSAFKALGLNLAGENEDAAENEDEYAEVTMGVAIDLLYGISLFNIEKCHHSVNNKHTTVYVTILSHYI